MRHPRARASRAVPATLVAVGLLAGAPAAMSAWVRPGDSPSPINQAPTTTKKVARKRLITVRSPSEVERTFGPGADLVLSRGITLDISLALSSIFLRNAMPRLYDGVVKCLDLTSISYPDSARIYCFETLMYAFSNQV